MTGAGLNHVEELMLMIGVVSMLASWGFRIRLFTKFGSDPVISELTHGTFATTFTDLLSIKLFRARADLPKESKATIFWFISLHWIAAAFLLLSLVSYAIRRWL